MPVAAAEGNLILDGDLRDNRRPKNDENRFRNDNAEYLAGWAAGPLHVK
jgi:hypothetical protein